jgi:hypothetical protein
VAHPIDNAGCKKIYSDKFHQQGNKIVPESIDKRQRNYSQNSYKKTTADGVKGIVVSHRNQPGEKEHTDIQYNHEVFDPGQVCPVYHHMVLVEPFDIGIHHIFLFMRSAFEVEQYAAALLFLCRYGLSTLTIQKQFLKNHS